MAEANQSEEKRLDPRDLDFLNELVDLSVFLDDQNSLEASLQQLAAMVADLLATENCSIMLLKEDQQQHDVALRVVAHHGYLPDAAYRETAPLNQGIAGRVAGRREPLLISNIASSSYAASAHRREPGGFISVPILIGSKLIGVLNLSKPRDSRIFNQEDLKIASIVALVVGKSIQVFRLQRLLHSNFIQLALTRETQSTSRKTLTEITHHSERMTKILAKTFFREMQEAGFGTDHILTAATEIISLLNTDLARRRQDEG